MTKLATSLLTALSAIAIPLVAVAQDSLQLTDGRFVTGPKMDQTGAGVVIRLQHGDVLVPAKLVKEATVTAGSDTADASLSESDKEKLAKGLVKFEGRWISQGQRDRLVQKRSDEIRERIATAMEHSKWASRYESESRYFKFQYTIDPDILQYWADLMDGYYKTFSKYWGGIRPPSGFGKLDVKFFHNNDYYDQVTGMAGTGGFFRFVPPLELDFYYDRLDEDWTLNVMFHETNHYLTWLIAPKYTYPIWLNEGLAEYYGASVWDPEKKQLEVGGLLEGRLANVQQDILEDNWLGLERMIGIPHSSFGGQYYGWAWSFVHFMMHSDYEKKFKRLFLALPKDTKQERERFAPGGYNMTRHPPQSQIAIMKKYLRFKDLKDLEREWHEYVKQLEPASGRGFFQFGRTALRDGMPIKATKMFEKSLGMGYESPMLYINYAEALAQRPKKNDTEEVADFEQAVAQFEKALELDPVNPLFRAGYAKMLNRAAKAAEKPNPEIQKQRAIAEALGEHVNGGYDSYSVFLALDWKVYQKGDD